MGQVKRFISYVGKVKLEHLTSAWQKPVDDVLKAIEKENPNITKAEIKGSTPHKSHTDPNDPKDVISVRLLKESGSRVESVHVHQDGTSKRKEVKGKGLVTGEASTSVTELPP